MPAKTRSSSGRFESSVAPSEKEEVCEETQMSIPIRKTTIMNIVRIIMIFLVVSPWLFLAMKKNTIDNVSKKISSFYDDNFSCTNTCVCEDLLADLKPKTNPVDDKNKTF